jgi:FMN-dependent dehydrogenase
MPLFCSPTALQRLFHHDGERAVAKAAEKFGTMFGVSSLGTVSEQVARHCGQSRINLRILSFSIGLVSRVRISHQLGGRQVANRYIRGSDVCICCSHPCAVPKLERLELRNRRLKPKRRALRAVPTSAGNTVAPFTEPLMKPYAAIRQSAGASESISAPRNRRQPPRNA